MTNKKKKRNKFNNPDYKLAEEQFYELNKEFYNGFLDDYYSLKVINLLSLITNTEKSIDNLISEPIEIDRLKINPKTEDIKLDNVVKNAKLELAMSFFHCMETFVRLFIAHAKLSGCPWLELAKLSLPKYKKELENMSKGKFEQLNTQISGDETILYVFTGYIKPENEITVDFIQGYKEWLSFAASQLLETYDYNSFKHGLAISPNQNGFTLGNPGEEFKIEAHGDVVEHLKRMKRQDRIIWAKQINFVKYDEKATFILFVEKLMKSILDTGRQTYLQTNEERLILKAHEFLPNDVYKKDEEQNIQVSGYSKGLLYYK